MTFHPKWAAKKFLAFYKIKNPEQRCSGFLIFSFFISFFARRCAVQSARF